MNESFLVVKHTSLWNNDHQVKEANKIPTLFLDIGKHEYNLIQQRNSERLVKSRVHVYFFLSCNPVLLKFSFLTA